MFLCDILRSCYLLACDDSSDFQQGKNSHARIALWMAQEVFAEVTVGVTQHRSHTHRRGRSRDGNVSSGDPFFLARVLRQGFVEPLFIAHLEDNRARPGV